MYRVVMKNHKVDICIYSIYLSIYLSYVSIKKCIGLYEQWIETDQTIGPDIPDRPRLYGLTLCTLCIASILPHALEWLYIHFCNILNTCNTPPPLTQPTQFYPLEYLVLALQLFPIR